MEHYWKSMWVENGYYVCKICRYTADKCTGKIIIEKESVQNE